MPRATTAACEVMPPRAVRMPADGVHAHDVLGARSRHAPGAPGRAARPSRPPARRSRRSARRRRPVRRAGRGRAGGPRRWPRCFSSASNIGCQQLDERARARPGRSSLAPVDHALLDHVDGDAHRGQAGALAGAGLEHVELAVLDRELHVLHVADSGVSSRAQIACSSAVGLGGKSSSARPPVSRPRRRSASGCGCRRPRPRPGRSPGTRRRALLAGGRVAGEGHAGGAVGAEVAEHHGLDVDRRAQQSGMLFSRR